MIEPRQLVAEGVAAVTAFLAPAGSAVRDEAPGRWLAFENTVRASNETPLGSLTQRLSLERFELQCLVLALAPHVEPRFVPGVVPDVVAGVALEHFCETAAERLDARRRLLPLSTLVRLRLLRHELRWTPRDLAYRGVRLEGARSGVCFFPPTRPLKLTCWGVRAAQVLYYFEIAGFQAALEVRWRR